MKRRKTLSLIVLLALTVTAGEAALANAASLWPFRLNLVPVRVLADDLFGQPLPRNAPVDAPRAEEIPFLRPLNNLMLATRALLTSS